MDDLDAFLRWNAPPLLEPRSREAYAIWIVHRALGVDPGPRRPVAPQMDVCVGPLRLGVSSAAHHQDGPRLQPGSPSFAIRARPVSAWVFCLLAEPDRERVDPLDLRQWRFWVVPSAALHPERQSIGEQALSRSWGEGLPYEQLASRIHELLPPAGP